MRDMAKIVSEAEHTIPLAYQLKAGEIRVLYELVNRGEVIKALWTAFSYGWALSRRCETNKRERKRKQKEGA